MAQGAFVSVSTTHTVASRFPSVSKDGGTHAALNAARTRFRGVGLLLALLMLTAANPVRACNWADLPFGFNVASFTYSIQTGTYIIGAHTFQYQYPAAVSQFTSACNSTIGVGNVYTQYANKRAYLSLWAFPTPFSGSQVGFELARSETLLLLVSNPNPDPNTVSPTDAGGNVWVGYGRDYNSPPIPPLTVLSNGTWYLTVFLFDAAAGSYSTFANSAQPLVIGPPPPPPPPTPIVPTEGMWWNPSESGSGYAIAVKHGVLVMTIYSYTATGAPQWYLLVGTLANNSTTAPLSKFQNGQCISCAYRLPVVAGDDGSATVTFTSATSATLILPGGRSIQIEPQDF